MRPEQQRLRARITTLSLNKLRQTALVDYMDSKTFRTRNRFEGDPADTKLKAETRAWLDGKHDC